MPTEFTLPWLRPGERFPPVDTAWPPHSDAPGLLAAGGALTPQTLHDAYSHGIFPWFSEGQPVLWWSTDPRMTLRPSQFRLHRSLRKTLTRFAASPDCFIRFDSAFGQVIRECASARRTGQNGTWIQPEMQAAYLQWHHDGFVHSVETWKGGQLIGGLYCVGIGRAVFGESMFALETDASKIALAALVCFCLEHGIEMIDCQQNTRHLASLGAAEITRESFVQHVQKAALQPAPPWRFEPLYWRHLIDR